MLTSTALGKAELKFYLSQQGRVFPDDRKVCKHITWSPESVLIVDGLPISSSHSASNRSNAACITE